MTYNRVLRWMIRNRPNIKFIITQGGRRYRVGPQENSCVGPIRMWLNDVREPIHYEDIVSLKAVEPKARSARRKS